MGGWRVEPAIVTRALEDLQSIIAFLRQNEIRSGRIGMTYNGIELRTDISYAGASVPALHAALPPVPEQLGAFTNEEDVAMIGLRDFLRSVAADRKRVWERRGLMMIRLSYETP